MERRKVWKHKGKGRTGSLAELETLMTQRGFSFQYEAGQPSYFDLGKALYKNNEGMELMLKRIAKGKPAMWTGAKVGLVRTAQQPDIWMVFRRRT
jgi:hypothetical protein